MTSQLFPSLATLAFAAVLSFLILKRRSRKINGREADEDAATNGGTAGGASSTHTSTEGQGIATSSGYDYEVFLSFRGPDTRAGFTDFLYTSLTDAGIRTFKDDEDLRKGEKFAPELLQAIEQSKILVPIFSKGYATSVWCLKEVAKMVECVERKNTRKQQIIPIFYDVAPAEVRHQTGVYKNAFLLHESKKRCDQNEIGEWKAALKAIGEINGYDLQSMSNGMRQGQFVKTFSQKIFNELKKGSLAVTSYFVPVDKHVDGIMQMMGSTTSEARIIGIHGMGGIGKTTIAKIIFNNFSHDFENPCFLSNIREMSHNGIQYLQNQLISKILKTQDMDIKDIDEGRQTIKDRLFNKRVLLLLDDVEEENHIYALVGNRDWLGEGSKIIITTRRIDILNVPEVDDRYELTHMDPNQSLQLFSKHAFRRDSPLDEYIDQSNRAIDIAGGLPLALEVIGSLLCRTKKKMWDSTLKMLESVPPNNIQNKLKISYDELDLQQKRIFLDIACLFIGYKKDMLIYFWDESGYFPEVAMDVLENMSLIKIEENNKVWMHDQLRDLGRYVVRQESEMKIEKQTRVWNPKEALDLLKRHKVDSNVEAFLLKLDDKCQHCFRYEDFKGLSNLRFLEVNSRWGDFCVEDTLLWHESLSNVLPTNVFHDDRNLLPHIRWLSWHYIPPTLNITKFYMKNVVILDLSYSEITDDWKGWSHMEEIKNLKVLDLAGCKRLERAPIFSAHSNLERLILRRCSSLIKIDTIMILESLIELDISETGIEELPDLIGNLINLKVVKMEGLRLNKVPNSFWRLEKVEEIDMTNGADEYHDMGDFHVRIDDCIYRNQSLRTLRLRWAKIYAVPPRLPESLIILKLSKLYVDNFPDPSNLTNLKELDLFFDAKYKGFVGSPILGWIGSLTKLESLSLFHCSNLHYLPSLPSSLSRLSLGDCYSLCSMGDLSNLKNLSSLYITSTAITEIQGLSCLENLQSLTLSCLNRVEILPDLSNLHKLRRLDVRDCANLDEMQGEFPRFLGELVIWNCKSLQELLAFSSSMRLQVVTIRDCVNLVKLPALSSSMRLQVVAIRDCVNLVKLSALSSSMGLQDVDIRDCVNLVKIEGELPQSLKKLNIFSCKSLHKLPHMRSSMELREINIYRCGNLVKIEGELPYSLETLNINSCESLRELPALPSSMGLRHVDICYFFNLVKIEGKLSQSLESLEIHYKKFLHKLPSLSNFMWLRDVVIHDCVNLVKIEGELPQSLEELKIYSCKSLLELPHLRSSMKLRHVYVCDCVNLVKIEGELPQSLEKLDIISCESLQELPALSSSMGLRHVDIRDCVNLVKIEGELPQSLETLKIHSRKFLQKLPTLSNLIGLRDVAIHDCVNLVKIEGELPQSLEKLKIYSCKSFQELPNLRSSKKLRLIDIYKCGNLVKIEGELPQSLETLDINKCESLQELPALSISMGLRHVDIVDCVNLLKIEGELPQSLEKLNINSCESLQELPALSSSMGLRNVVIRDCVNLVKIEGELPQSLTYLEIYSCKSLQELPHLRSSMRLRYVVIHDCVNLVKIEGELPQSLDTFKILSCESLEELPALSSLMGLSMVEIKRCKKLDVKAIALLCSEKSVKFVGEHDESKGEYEESESQYEGEDEE